MSSRADFTEKLQDTLQLTTKLGQGIKTLVTSINEIEDYFNTNTTVREWEAFMTISKKVANLCSEADQLAERANDKLHVAFIGPINAGKTTLINCLVHSDVLPVMDGETTFCSVAISGTLGNKMIATERKSGKRLKADSLKELLNILKAKSERKRLGIEPNSVIDIRSPTAECRALAENVVLYDTPGIGHRPETDDAVVDLCKKADVVVAVMDIHSPSLRTILDVVKEVRCSITYAVFTRWDSFRKDNSDTDAKERKKDYATDFRNAVPKDGDVFFVDSISIKNKKNSDGSDGFKDFERTLDEAKKALKLEALKIQLEKILSEATSVTNDLMQVIQTRKNKLIDNLTAKFDTYKNFEETYKNHFKSMGEAIMKIMAEETKSVQEGDFDKVIDCEMKKKGSREETLEICRDRLISKIEEKVNENSQFNEHRLAISKGFKEMEPELPSDVPVPVRKSLEKKDFELDKDFTFKDNNLHSYLTKPGWLLKGMVYGTMTAVGSVAMLGAPPLGTVLGIGSAVAGPTVNYLLPVTDVCEWVKFFWPASSEEITAVKEFFKTKTRKLEKEKFHSLMEEIYKLQNKADTTVQARNKSLEEDIEFLKTGNSRWNTQMSIMNDLEKLFKELKEKAKVITQETEK